MKRFIRTSLSLNIKLLALALCSVIGSTTSVYAAGTPKPDYDFYQSNDIIFYDPTATESSCNTGGNPSVNGNGLKAIYSYFLGLQLSPEQAAAATGNISVETGGTGDPTIVQGGKHTDDPSNLTTKGHAYGIVQWDPGNRVFEEFKKAKVPPPVNSLAGQLQTVAYEMKHGTPAGRTNFNAGFRKITDVAAATQYWMTNFEGTTSDLSGRAKAAKIALTTYPHDTQIAASTGCDNGTGVTTGCSVTAPIHGEDGSKDHKQLNKDQLIKAFGKGGPDGANNMTDVTFMGKSLTVNKKIVGCLKAVEGEIKQDKSTYKVTGVGGYRSVKGAGRAALDAGYHWYGAAIDINPATNPYSDSGVPLPHDMPQEYIDAFHHHGFSWGGNWSAPKDYMHFEFNGVDP